MPKNTQNKSHEGPPIVVIGGGLAGLSAALHLAERSLPPIVLEADPTFAGGRVAGDAPTIVNGWEFKGEHGVHGIWSSYRNLQAMLSRHNIRPMFIPAHEEAWIYKRGGKVRKASVGTSIRHSPLPSPFHYLNLFLRPKFLRMLMLRDWLSLPLVWGGLLWGVGVDPLAENQPLKGMWLSDLVKNWAPAVRAFFVGLARNGLSATPEEIPLSGFIAFLRFYTLMRRDAWTFSYMPADGGTSLINPIIKRFKELGGKLYLNKEVTHIEKDGDKWQVHYRVGEKSTSSEVIKTQQVILATDSPNTAKIVENSPDLTTETQLYWPRGMSTAIVRIWYDTSPKPGPEGGIFSGEYVIDNFFWLHIIQDQYRRWHKETGGSAIEVHIYGPPDLLEEPDATLLSRAAADVQSAFPELRSHRIHQMIRRNPPTHTLFGLGPAECHLGVETPWQDIYCCGDWVRHPTPAFFLERACVTGIFAANAVLQSKGEKDWPVMSYPEPEPLVAFIEKIMRKGRRLRKERK
jgi:isorenieratene synthase